MVELVTLVLGRFSIDFRKLLYRYAVNLIQGEGILAKASLIAV